MAGLDSLSEQTDMATIEKSLGWSADSPYMAGGWNEHLRSDDGRW
jgi:hypothetical protein